LNPLAGITIMVILFISGFLSSGVHYQLNSPNHFSYQSFSHYQGVVDSWPEERGRFKRVIIKVEKVRDSAWSNATGKIQLYIPINQSDSISYGSVMIVNGSPIGIKGPRNPFEFDYRKYLARKNIFHQHFLGTEEYIISDLRYPNALKANAGIIRNKADKVLQENFGNSDQLGIVRAMLLGIRSGIDEEMSAAYSHTGAMHILAISGLHVGILYGFLALMLAPLRRSRRGKYFFTIIILLTLWSYALVVGMSPSVIRATVMFSLITVGYAFYRTPDIFNTIAFSAFLLLVINPFQLFGVGFQFSYLAVTGIVLIYKNINGWFTSDFWLINRVWSITSVAIAAQLMTFPLALHYFHNFPNLFFISNLLVIPSAVVILISGFALLLSSVFSIGFFTDLFSSILSYTLEIMNRGVSIIERIPNSYIDDVYLSGFTTFLLYLIIIGLLAALLSRRVRWVYFLTIMCLGFSITVSASRIWKNQKQLMMIYDVHGETVIDFVRNGKIESVIGGYSEKDIGYHVDNFRITNVGSKKVEEARFAVNSLLGVKLFSLGDKSLIWIDNELNQGFEPLRKLSVDYILISNNSLDHFDTLDKMFRNALIILDSSNDYYYSRKASILLREMGFRVYNTSESGGLELDLESTIENAEYEL